MNTLVQYTKSVFSPGAFLVRLLLFAAGWFILVGGQTSDLWFVLLVLLLTTLISLYCVPPGQWRLRPLGVLAFLPYFFITAMRGGWDVARRAYHPGAVSVDPGFLTVSVSDDMRQTLLLAWIISLLPGTASCEIKDRTLLVHVLDKKLPVEAEIADLQKRIARMTA
ncbi:MAG: Na+/H+ antiporter subunit E [Opitutales bacterium]|nr:Na+/H+ antiporter subunit E [Opitutales bacterium]